MSAPCARSQWIPRATMAAIAAAILGYQLLAPPPVGLANNGDFSKVIGIFDLAAPGPAEYAFVDLKYDFHPDHHWRSGFCSSEMLLTAMAIAGSSVFSKDGTFDLRWMGFVHGLLFLWGLWLLAPLLSELTRVRQVLLSAAILLVFTDVMYVSCLNSFYMDAAGYVFLALSAVFFLRAARWRRRSDALCLVVCVVLMTTAKIQHAVLGVWVAVLFAFWGAHLWPGRSRMFRLASTAITLAATAGTLELAAPKNYAARGVYSVIFYQILPHSDHISDDLRALGLDESYRQWVGTHAFSEGARLDDPAFVAGFMRRTSYVRVAWYFATHPRSVYLALDTSLAAGGRQRPLLGNFARSAGLWPFAESQAFAIWSNGKRKLLDGHGTRCLIAFVVLAGLVCGLASMLRRSLPPVVRGGVYVLAGMGITAMLVASLADAIDVPRHHFISNAIFDLLVLTALSLLCAATAGRGAATPARAPRGG